MKKVLVLFGLALALSGCVGTMGGAIPAGEISAKAKQIQTYVKLGCSFLPTLGTVAAILSGGTTSSVATIAEEICTAVTTMPLAQGPNQPKPMVRGVVIKGRRV